MRYDNPYRILEVSIVPMNFGLVLGEKLREYITYDKNFLAKYHEVSATWDNFSKVYEKEDGSIVAIFYHQMSHIDLMKEGVFIE